MTRETALKILEVQEAFRNDPEFESLWEEHQMLADRFTGLMQVLPKEQSDIIDDFFGIVNELHLRTLACAVSKRE